MPDDKKKQAMSLLFGDAPPKPDAKPPEQTPAEARATPPPADEAVPPEPQPRTEPPRAPNRGGGRPAARPPAPTPDPYYQGASRYRRQSGEQVKHSVYLDPDVSQAVKVAAALGDDPRGTNISAIVNQTLRDAGYGGG